MLVIKDCSRYRIRTLRGHSDKEDSPMAKSRTVKPKPPQILQYAVNEVEPPPWPEDCNESLTIAYYRVANVLKDYGYKIVKDDHPR